MAHRAIACRNGPNCNKLWEVLMPEVKAPALGRGHQALAAGQALSDVAPVERASIDALALSYPTDPEIEDYQPCNDGFSIAMKPV